MSLAFGSAPELGYGLLFGWVLAEQGGLPVPAVPILLAMGALTSNGKLHFGMALLVAFIGSMLADLVWYEAGRYRGITLIHSLCRISLERDSCARRVQTIYGSYGVFALVIAKFIPGLSFAAPPLSGVFQMRRWRFLLFDGAGAFLWIVSYMGLGFFFASQLTEVAHIAAASGRMAVVGGSIAATGIFITWKVRRRKRFLLKLRAATISPKELKAELDAGNPLTILDVRHPLDLLSTPFTLPSAIRFPLESMEKGFANLSHDQCIVIYCTCPHQASSYRAVELLHDHGFNDVKVLDGGFQAWRDQGFEVRAFEFSSTETEFTHSIWAF